VFNFDWSVDIEGAGGNLGDYSYVLSVDQDQSAAVSYATFDPLALATYYDHSLGTSSTPNGGGVESTSNAELLSNILLYTVMQQSTNLGFGFSANPHSAGIFNIKFEVFDKTATTLLSSAEIVVQVVPLPAALPMFGAGLGLLLLMRYRRRRTGSPIAA
jgi:hypothetical protein